MPSGQCKVDALRPPEKGYGEARHWQGCLALMLQKFAIRVAAWVTFPMDCVQLAGGPFKPAVGLSGAFEFAVVLAFLGGKSPSIQQSRSGLFCAPGFFV